MKKQEEKMRTENLDRTEDKGNNTNTMNKKGSLKTNEKENRSS